MRLAGVVAAGAALALGVMWLVFPDRVRVASSVGVPGLPPPPSEVWPEAVHELPLRLPDGNPYQPILFLDRDRMLIKVEAGLLASYDLRTGEVKDLVRLRKEIRASGFAVGSGAIVWWTSRRDRDGQVVDIWTAPITGGKAAVRASARPDGLVKDPRLQVLSSALVSMDSFSGLSVAGGNIYWSSVNAGLWRLPLAGGAPPAPVPGTAGYHLLSYPWMGRPDEWGRPLPPGQATPGDTNRPVFGDLLNIETGETSTAVIPPDTHSWTCGLTRCMGPLPGNSGENGAAQSRDGSAQRRLPSMETQNAAIARDRFSILRVYGTGHRVEAVALVDLKTGEAGLVGRRGVGDGLARGQLFHHTDLYSYRLNDKMIIVDLRAIP
ncbi:hypothetical protein Acor_28920 [Acrocarpospora corrugata]|uniref:Uncharacterized protein n=1 Tax=Acrocarpospora corrugata TaxID=35763 RepID=A0A5M3W2K4_9ACTN|nr:hypothetical protein Acor_28920 [Acrocarpospora corrugata]